MLSKKAAEEQVESGGDECLELEFLVCVDMIEKRQ